MEQKFQYQSNTSSSSNTPETKSDIIALAVGNPINRSDAKLSKKNQNLLIYDDADLFVKRHNDELQRCSQFYSLASLFHETSSKDKHRLNRRNIKKMYYTGRKNFLKLFICF